MSVATIDEAIKLVDNAGTSNADKAVNTILKSNESKWNALIGARSADDMSKETAAKWDGKSKKDASNARKRLDFMQTVFKQYAESGKKKNDDDDSKDEENKNDDHGHGSSALEPIDELLKCTSCKSIQIDNSNVYSISSQSHLALDCNFSNKNNGKYYYEVELLQDLKSFDDINIGWANDKHSKRSEVGLDSSSYGLNLNKNRLYHVDSSYGKVQWKKDDVLGVAVDLTNADDIKLEFYLNGESQGVAFNHIDVAEGNGLFIGFTIQKSEANHVFIYNNDKFKQKMPDGYSTINIDDMKKENDELWKVEGAITYETVDDGIKITSTQGFPTLQLKGSELKKGNKYYYEILLGSGSLMQLGVCDNKFAPNAAYGEGIGDDDHSWGIDLMRLKKWGQSGLPFTDKPLECKSGDNIGCLINLDDALIEYYYNGKSLGTGFKNVSKELIANGLAPSVSLRNNASHKELMAIYQLKRKGQSTDHLTEPKDINYFNIIFNENKLKYKPTKLKNVNGISKNLMFKINELCSGLKNYSLAQYRDDFFYNDTLIILQNDNEFDKVTTNCGSSLVVVDFFATWCGPCVHIAPVFHKMSAEYTDVVFLKVDVDKLKILSKEKEISCMPTFQFYKNNKMVHKLEGPSEIEIREAIEKYRNEEATEDKPADDDKDKDKDKQENE